MSTPSSRLVILRSNLANAKPARAGQLSNGTNCWTTNRWFPGPPRASLARTLRRKILGQISVLLTVLFRSRLRTLCYRLCIYCTERGSSSHRLQPPFRLISFIQTLSTKSHRHCPSEISVTTIDESEPILQSNSKTMRSTWRSVLTWPLLSMLFNHSIMVLLGE